MTNDTSHSLSNNTTELTYELDGDERHSEVVVRAVASLTNTAVYDLEPLYDVIDPHHLDGVFEGSGEHSDLQDVSITIDFEGCRVTVTEWTVHARQHTAVD